MYDDDDKFKYIFIFLVLVIVINASITLLNFSKGKEEKNISYLDIKKEEERLLLQFSNEGLLDLKYIYLQYLEDIKSKFTFQTDFETEKLYIEDIFNNIFLDSEQLTSNELKNIFELINFSLEDESFISELELYKRMLQTDEKIKYIGIRISNEIKKGNGNREKLERLKNNLDIDTIDQLINEQKKIEKEREEQSNKSTIILIMIIPIAVIASLLVIKIENKISEKKEKSKQQLKQQLINESIENFKNRYEEATFILREAPPYEDIIHINDKLKYTGLESVERSISRYIETKDRVSIMYTIDQSGVKFWVYYLDGDQWCELKRFTQSEGDMLHIELRGENNNVH